MRKLASLTALLLILSSTADAKDSDYEKAMARAVAAIENQSYSEATVELNDALAIKNDDSQALLYLGIAQARTGDMNAESTLKSALRSDPSNSRIHYELGNLYMKRASFEEAKDYYEEVIRNDGEGELSESARNALKMINSRKESKRWDAKILTGFQYDDNVVPKSCILNLCCEMYL